MAQANLDYEVPAHLRRDFLFQTAGILPPNGILFGFNTIRKVGEQAKKLEGTRAILITDAVMVQLGYADLVRGALEKEGLKVEVFGKVEPEPHMETADAIYEMLLRTKFDLVVGLGGGSSLDIAKLISLVATNGQKPFDLIRHIAVDKKEVAKPALKKILIPTTSGTGSEVSKFFVVSSGKDKFFPGSPYACPEIAIIDPGLTLSMPPPITASTGVDALSHAVESLMNKVANPWTDGIALTGTELVGKYLRRATFNGQDLEARYYMSMAATLSMMALSLTGGLYAHSISYVLARYQSISHGIGRGVSLPYTMAFNLPMIESRLALVARALTEPVEALSPRGAGKRAVEMVYELIAEVKMPVSLKEMGFQHEDLSRMAEICVTQYPRPNNPRPMSKEDCLALFEAMWAGDIRRL